MRQRWPWFRVVFLLMFSASLFAQPVIAGKVPLLLSPDYRGKIPVVRVQNNKEVTRSRFNIAVNSKRPVDSCASRNLFPGGPIKMHRHSVAHTLPLFRPSFSILPDQQYTRHTGWFCQKEWQLEKNTGIPFRFRLGSLDYVNWLEQKPNTIKPQ